MNTTITEIAHDIFRISTFNPVANLQYNQFLVRGDQPFLMHTGMRSIFTETLKAVRQLTSSLDLAWIGFSHVEGDECGALADWYRVAPQARPVCSFVGAMISVDDIWERPARHLSDNEVLDIGRHKLRFLRTPHVPHCWEAGLFFEETTRTLMCSDLFLQIGETAAVTSGDIVGPTEDAIKHHLQTEWAHDMPYTPYTDATLSRLEQLDVDTLAVMHGASLRGDCSTALRDLRGVLRKHIG